MRGAERRSNPDCFRGDGLDCFAALAMTETRLSIPAARSCPSFASFVSLSEKRAQGMPGAGCTREPCVQKECTLRTQATQVQPDNRHSPRNGFTAYTWSPRCTGLVSHRRFAFVTQGLIPASGNRDRTISPYAFGASSLHQPRPSHPATRQVTIGRNAPLAGRDGWNIGMISLPKKRIIFESGA